MPERLFTLLIMAAAGLVAAAFLWLLGDLAWRGMSHLSWSFLVSDPENSGRTGGIASILISTLLILSVALLVAIPLGLATAIWLAEYTHHDGAFTRAVRLSLDMLAGVPSIVFGLFGYAFFCLFLQLGFSILAGGLTLACMVLPILIRTSESGLRAVSDDWRRGTMALGMSRASALWHIVLPAATPAITAGILLGIGRATAETAALVFTSGYVDRMPESLTDSGRALAVHIYELSMNITGGDQAAYASALVLIALIIVINATALILSDKWVNKRVTI